MFTQQELGNMAAFLQRVNVTGAEAPTLVALQQKINILSQSEVDRTVPKGIIEPEPKGKKK